MANAPEILDNSAEGVVSELTNLFNPPPTQVSVVSSWSDTYLPSNPLSKNTPVIFRVPSSDRWVDLSNVWLTTKIKLTFEDGDLPDFTQLYDNTGEEIPHVATDSFPNVGTINMPAVTWIKNMEMNLGNYKIDTNDDFGLTQYVLNTLNASAEAKKTVLAMAGWGEEEHNVPLSERFKANRDKFAKSKTVEFSARLVGGVFDIQHLLPSFTDITIKLTPQSDDFFCLVYAPEQRKARFEIVDCRLSVRKSKLSESVASSLIDEHHRNPLIYRFNRCVMRSIYVNGGQYTLPYHRVSHMYAAQRAVVFFGNPKHINGKKNKKNQNSE